MQIVLAVGVLGLSYLLGSVPFGLLIVKIKTGKDIRSVESGRTGGTNAMRAAGFFAGLMTAIFDLLKSAACVWIARALVPGADWLQAFAPDTRMHSFLVAGGGSTSLPADGVLVGVAVRNRQIDIASVGGDGSDVQRSRRLVQVHIICRLPVHLT